MKGRRPRLLQPNRRGGSAFAANVFQRFAETWTADHAAGERVSRLSSISWRSQHLCHLQRIQPTRNARVRARSPQRAMMPSRVRRARGRRSVKPRAGMLGAKAAHHRPVNFPKAIRVTGSFSFFCAQNLTIAPSAKTLALWLTEPPFTPWYERKSNPGSGLDPATARRRASP